MMTGKRLKRKGRDIIQRAQRKLQQRRMVRFHAGLINKGDLCFDIGANMGNRTDILLSVGARVVCVEPQPACISVLEEKFSEDPRVVLVNAGLGSEPGTAQLELANSTTLATLASHWKTGRFCSQSWHDSIEIELTTMDALLTAIGRPAFCKIDVEGYELPVLKGLSQSLPLLSFEFTHEFLGEAMKCIDRITSLGRTHFNYTLGEQTWFECDRWLEADELKQTLGLRCTPGAWGDIYARSIRLSSAEDGP